jgi:hypothetical protein
MQTHTAREDTPVAQEEVTLSLLHCSGSKCVHGLDSHRLDVVSFRIWYACQKALRVLGMKQTRKKEGGE